MSVTRDIVHMMIGGVAGMFGAVVATGELMCYVAGRGLQNYSNVVLKALEA